MGTVLLRGAAVFGAAVAVAAGIVAAGGVSARAATTVGAAAAGSSPSAGTSTAGMPRQLFVPDLLGALPTGLSDAELAKLRKLPGVRNVLAVDGGSITIRGGSANVIGVRPGQFQAWTPPSTAADHAAWTALSRGEVVPGPALAHRLRLRSGGSYPVTAANRTRLAFAASAAPGISGVDAVVDRTVAGRLGLVHDLAVLVNAPGANLAALTRQVRAVLGARGKVVRLQPTVTTVTSLPVTNLPTSAAVPSGRPTTYLALYQEAAARYCPGLSWTVLAAIGEVESGDGADMGPSSAGALGPMQFLPSTWKTWGIDGFGETGTPNIMDPLDAVASAAVYLCGYGAAQGGSALYHAIWEYNHADWYVNEVLAIAKEYAQDYS